MKTLSFFIAALFFTTCCLAQKIVNRRNNLTDMVTEKYQTIITADKQIKQGIYNAFYDRSTVIANGSYAHDKKKGIWHFFDQRGKLIENYNYDTNSLLYEAAEDSTSNIKYRIDNKVTFTDVVTKPVRPGGRYYGYVPYLKAFKLPDDMFNIYRQEYAVTLEILVSAMGRLADFKIHIRSVNFERVINIDTGSIDDQDRVFIPATFNNTPILSSIFIECYITNLNGLDM